MHEGEARRVPDLVGKGAVALDALDRQRDVAAAGDSWRQREAQGVGAEGREAMSAVLAFELRRRPSCGGFAPVDRGAERVDDVALRLGHLVAVLVAHHAVQVDACGRAAVPMKCMPIIIMRATQKKRMS